MLRQTCMAVLVALCWGVSGQIGSAQQPGLTEPKPIAGPRPIPLSEIASQAESTFRSVQNIESTLSTDQLTTTVERRLAPLKNHRRSPADRYPSMYHPHDRRL